MAGQTIGTVNVQVGGPPGMAGQTIGTVNIQVDGQSQSRVGSISYGGRTLKSATDLSVANAVTGAAILYQANTNTFVLGTVATETIASVDAGTF